MLVVTNLESRCHPSGVVLYFTQSGQFAKPRSADMEEKDGVELPSYRGDNINSDEFTLEVIVMHAL